MRPIGVAILAILIILFGLLVALVGILALVGTFFVAVVAPEFTSIALVAALIFLILGSITIVSGIGLWQLRMWAWVLAFIVLILHIIGQLLAFGITFNIVLIIDVILLIYLLLVRNHFY